MEKRARLRDVPGRWETAMDQRTRVTLLDAIEEW